MKNSKLVIFLSCLFAATFTAPLVTAAAHGGGFSGGHSFAGRPGMGMPGRPGMGMRSGFNRHNRFDRDRFREDNDFIFIGDFGFPWWWGWGWGPWWGYPYDYGYGYGYGGYGNGYGYEYGYSSRSRVAELQRRLSRAGYYQGSIDGIMGPHTRRAIRAYERDHNQRTYGMTDRY
jgi:Putative peptidoglycan binding domain